MSDIKPWLWKPGQSGNPKGRPRKGRSLTEILREKLDSEQLLGKPVAELFGVEFADCATVADVLIEAAIGHAIKKGDPRLFAEILRRIDGRERTAEPTAIITAGQEDFTVDLTPDDDDDGQPEE